MAAIGPSLDAALLALEVEIFRDDPLLTESDEFLVRTLSIWSVEKRIETLSALIDGYGNPDFGSHIVHALARVICRDVELQLGILVRQFSRLRG
jgi:hypothetical protein